ncbi:MAG: hypothetical protein E6J87_20095, partial [Deltaproteobacteria bacterium]
MCAGTLRDGNEIRGRADERPPRGDRARCAPARVRGARGARGPPGGLRRALLPDRGSIVDRNGAGLALTVEAPSVYAVGREIGDPAAAARALAPILGADRRALANGFRQRKGFSFVRRWITPEQGEKITAAKIPGVGVVSEPRRLYPYRALAARVIGFANIDGNGARGIEQQENAWLRG